MGGDFRAPRSGMAAISGFTKNRATGILRPVGGEQITPTKIHEEESSLFMTFIIFQQRSD
jgi:hypothetical protein